MRHSTRRQFLKLALHGAAGVTGVASAGALAADLGRSEAAVRKRPNVLMIVVDDLNDWVGCLGGHPDVRTPNIDRLAALGTLFTRAYCASPVCNPSRTSLFTGIRPSTSGVYGNKHPWRAALPDAVTLPRQFMNSGYKAIGTGKIFHYEDRNSWDRYERRKPGAHGDLTVKIPKHGVSWEELDNRDGDMSDAKTVKVAHGVLQYPNRKEPFFLAVGLTRPHLPWSVPKRHFARYPLESIRLPETREDDLDDVPPIPRGWARSADHRSITSDGGWHAAVRAYLASISFMDAMVGRLLASLATSPAAGKTIVVLCSDHGFHLGEKLHWHKSALWEDTTRVPLIVVAPGTTSPGTRCERTVGNIDLYPTLTELCGIPAPAGLEGTSLLPLLTDPTHAWSRPALTTHLKGNHSVRSERWRYTRYVDGSEELYDEQNDPNEWHNLAAHPEHAAVKRELATWFPKTDAEPAATDPDFRKRVELPRAPSVDRARHTEPGEGRSMRAPGRGSA